MFYSDIERDQVPFICKTLGCRPVASPDHFTPEALAHVENVDELPIGTGNNCLKVPLIPLLFLIWLSVYRNRSSIKDCLSSDPIIERKPFGRGKKLKFWPFVNAEIQAERSIHDALCVLRCLVKNRNLVAGGGAVESELALRLGQRAKEIGGVDGYCLQVKFHSFWWC